MNPAPSDPGAWRLQVYEALGSTSDLCRILAIAGEPGPLAILARRQTQGRGTQGREWVSAAGNLFLSVLLRSREQARDVGQWSLLAGVALAEALSPLLPNPQALRLKWPNDLLLDGAKLAGILVESSATPDGTLEWLVIGIGVNIVAAPELPDRRTAALAQVATPPAAEDLARLVLARLAHWRQVRLLEGFAPVRAAWLERAPALGTPLTLRLGKRSLGGSFAGLGHDGSLLLATGGRVHAFAAGET